MKPLIIEHFVVAIHAIFGQMSRADPRHHARVDERPAPAKCLLIVWAVKTHYFLLHSVLFLL
jgi:hypothetical protein